MLSQQIINLLQVVETLLDLWQQQSGANLHNIKQTLNKLVKQIEILRK